NVLITMLLGGLWHGANWTFVLWGGMHGIAIVVNQAWHGAALRKRLLHRAGRAWHWLAVLVTFNVVTWLWIPFRAPDMATAARGPLVPFCTTRGAAVESLNVIFFLVMLIAVAAPLHRFDRHSRARLLCNLVTRKNLRAPAWTAITITWLTVVAVTTGSSAKF